MVNALREELTQYGEVLALMQEQQELIINRAANDLLINLNHVNEQMERVAIARNQRGNLPSTPCSSAWRSRRHYFSPDDRNVTS